MASGVMVLALVGMTTYERASTASISVRWEPKDTDVQTHRKKFMKAPVISTNLKHTDVITDSILLVLSNAFCYPRNVSYFLANVRVVIEP